MQEGEEQVQEQVETPPAAQEQPIFRGLDRDIADPKELASYTAELERKLIEQEARRMPGFEQPAPQPVEPSSDPFYKQVAEKFILQPEDAVRAIEERVAQRITGSVEQRIEREKAFQAFYEKHEDLVGQEDIVQLVLQKHGQAWKNLPWEKAQKLLAAETRSRISAIRGEAPAPARVKPLQDKPAAALRPSGESARVVRVEQDKEPETLVETIRKQQQARREANLSARTRKKA